MKKHYVLMCFGLLLVIAVIAQQKSALQLYGDRQPLMQKATMFDFDSLNVNYEGSWGFGQSFSIATNAAGTVKFIGSGAGVIILDVTNPTTPVKISEFSTRGLVDAIYFDESTNRLFVTAYFAGFEIWDLSNIQSPVKIGWAPTVGLPRGGIYADGNIVYVVSVNDGLQVFDITIPSAPIFVGSCVIDPDNLCWTSAKSGNYIYACLNEGGLKIIDVTNPSNPFIAGSYSDVVYGVAVVNNKAYVVSYSFGLGVLDISDLSNITLMGNVSLIGFPYRVEVQGNYAYVGNSGYNGEGGINVVDVTTPASPSLVATVTGFAEHIATAGNTLAFTGGSYPCTILDITIPTAPVIASTYTFPVFTSDIYVDGNYAYTGNLGFRVFDISDKAHPVQVGYNNTDGSIVRTVGDKAVYIRESMSSNSPVMVMDISDKTNPQFIGQYMSPVMTTDLEVKGNLAYVSCWWDGIRIVSIEDPANPVLVKHAMGWSNGGTPGVTYCYAQAIDLEGNYLYIIDYGPFAEEDTKGLYIIDVSDVTNPVLVSRLAGILSYGYDLDAVGNFVYIADNYGGIEVIDVTDKANPYPRGYANLPDGANAIKVTENQAFLADYINGGVQVVDVTDPDNPVISGYYLRSGCFALGIDVKGQYIYLADGAGGFQIYHTSLITATKDKPQPSAAEYTSFPNPFSDNLVIKGRAGSITELQIYDAAGNKVITLRPTSQTSDEVIYQWNGKTASGTPVKPGLYLYQAGDVSGKVVKSSQQSAVSIQ